MKPENNSESVSGNENKICPDCGSTMVEEHHYPGMFYCEVCAEKENWKIENKHKDKDFTVVD